MNAKTILIRSHFNKKPVFIHVYVFHGMFLHSRYLPAIAFSSEFLFLHTEISVWLLSVGLIQRQLKEFRLNIQIRLNIHVIGIAIANKYP